MQLIGLELLKVKDIIAEGSFKKKKRRKSILCEVLLVIFLKSLDLEFERKKLLNDVLKLNKELSIECSNVLQMLWGCRVLF